MLNYLAFLGDVVELETFLANASSARGQFDTFIFAF